MTWMSFIFQAFMMMVIAYYLCNINLREDILNFGLCKKKPIYKSSEELNNENSGQNSDRQNQFGEEMGELDMLGAYVSVKRSFCMRHNKQVANSLKR